MKKILLALCLIYIASADAIISLKEQGSFAIGGVVIKNNEGKTSRVDHAFVSYQIPSDAKKYPLVFAHGIRQFAKTYQSTPDGREGFDSIFLKKHYSVYLVDQPRRARASKSSQEVLLKPEFSDEMYFNHFRLGIYPNFFKDVQFSKDKEALNQFLRQIVPTIGESEDLELYAKTYALLFDKLGGGIFITHSQGGAVGWKTALKTDNIKALIAYEPGGEFPFPQGQMPKEGQILTRANTPEGIEIDKEEFLKYTRFPIIIYYGDFIPKSEDEAKEYPLSYAWNVRLKLAREWVRLINENGGDAKVVHLPEIGIFGNTHFPMSDLNNAQIAELLSEFLEQKGLDK